jgi:hypothetical protein
LYAGKIHSWCSMFKSVAWRVLKESLSNDFLQKRQA